jgi:hypothetical protein
MKDFAGSIAEDVFEEERDTIVHRLRHWKRHLRALHRQHRLVAYAALVALVIICIYWWHPGLLQALVLIFDPRHIPLLRILALFVWLLLLTYRSYQKNTHQREFVEDFRDLLKNWEHDGGWRIIGGHNENILVVANSPIGGIAKPCRSWKDYRFEFETKIVGAKTVERASPNTSWIIRAKDSLNYVMLQCQQEALYPHHRVNGEWKQPGPELGKFKLPLDEWFSVRIEVKGTQAVVTVTVNNKPTKIYSGTPFEPPHAPARYRIGSVGFRAGKGECAYFRRVRVKKI